MYKWYVREILLFVNYIDYKEINYWYIMDIFLKNCEMFDHISIWVECVFFLMV